ncbi:MAG: hypothetical protein ACW98Y_19815 [Candidatus Thorarchaeota archaeon]|jgi:hypothetical protein
MQDPERGRIFTVSPLLNLHNLGFEYLGTVVETNSLKQTNRLEKLIEYHPYIRHRSRCYGASNGLIFQFRSPSGTREKILKFLDAIVEKNMAIRYRILASDQTPPVYTSLSARGWEQASLTWDFDWDKWFTTDGTIIPKKKPQGKPGKSLSWLTKKDIFFMNEVLKGARRKNKEIMNSLSNQGIDFTPQTLSRRYSTIKEECFDKYRTFIDASIFDVYNSVLITGEASKNYLSKLSARLNTHPIPFGSTLRTAGKELFWHVRLQGSHLSKLISRISSDLESMSLYIMDYTESARYFLEPDAFNEEEHMWIQDEQFMIQDVLKG